MLTHQLGLDYKVIKAGYVNPPIAAATEFDTVERAVLDHADDGRPGGCGTVEDALQNRLDVAEFYQRIEIRQRQLVDFSHTITKT